MISDTYNEENLINNATKKVLESNMTNKGFTLIELLAVILILGIISLISVPVVSNIVDSSEKGSAESSMMGYIDAIEKKAMLAQISSKDTISAGAHTAQELATLNIKVKGEYPDDASIFMIDNEGRVTEGWATYRDGKYKVYYDGTYAVADKDNYLDKSGEQHNSIPEPGTKYEDKGIVVYSAASNGISNITDGVADYKTLNRLAFLKYTFIDNSIAKQEVCAIIGDETEKLLCLDKDAFNREEELIGYFDCDVDAGEICDIYIGKSYESDGTAKKFYRIFERDDEAYCTDVRMELKTNTSAGRVEVGFQHQHQICSLSWTDYSKPETIRTSCSDDELKVG